MDWTATRARLEQGMTELAEELTMWRPDLPCRIQIPKSSIAAPAATELWAEVAEPHRGFEAVYLTAAFEREHGLLTATAAIRLDHAEDVVAGRTAEMPREADPMVWARDETDAVLSFLHSQVPAVRRWTEAAVGAKPLPSRPVVRKRMVDLIAGRREVETIADWAMHYTVHDEEYEVTDWVVRRALRSLSGADMLIGPETYLYGEIDFRNWLAELDAGVAG